MGRIKEIVLRSLGICLALVLSFLCALAIWFGRTNWNPPQIFEGQFKEDDHLKRTEVDARLTSLLVQRFPTGTPEAILIWVLQDQGFKFRPPALPNCRALDDAVEVGVGLHSVLRLDQDARVRLGGWSGLR